MGTVIDRLDVTRGGWRTRHSALHLAVAAAKTCLQGAGREPDDVDLLINTGIYRDKNLAEPALAALIQEDIGANPEDPHEDAHGTFSFDISNGTCGVLTALQIVDGFLRSHTINCALVVASDANPGRGMSEHFPFSPVGAALLCGWSDDDFGLGRVHWVNIPDDGENFRATVGLEDSRNVLRFSGSAAMDEQFAAAGAQVGPQLPPGGLARTFPTSTSSSPRRPGTAIARHWPPNSQYRWNGSPSPTTRACIPPRWWRH